MSTRTIVLRDRASGQRVWLYVRRGVVVGAMGSSPRRYLGMKEEAARHRARYAQK